MTDELKAKLYKLLYDFFWDGSGGDGNEKDPEITDCIVQIHQAYIDAGYILPGQEIFAMPKGKDLARHMAGLDQIVDDGVNTIELAPPMMTGQEWYERFERLLKPLLEDHPALAVGTETIEAVKYIARKAAGLEE